MQTMTLTMSERKLCWPAYADVKPFEVVFRTPILDRPLMQECCNSIFVNYESREIGASATRRLEKELLQNHGETSYSYR